jgi:hypothetical protein
LCIRTGLTMYCGDATRDTRVDARLASRLGFVRWWSHRWSMRARRLGR